MDFFARWKASRSSVRPLLRYDVTLPFLPTDFAPLHRRGFSFQTIGLKPGLNAPENRRQAVERR
jgi:hypothetical protein